MRIDQLPEPYHQLVRKRANPIVKFGTNRQSLAGAFAWSDTPEGHSFWLAVDRAKTLEELPAIPQKEEVA